MEVINIAEYAAKKVHLEKARSVQDGGKSSVKGKVICHSGQETIQPINTHIDAVNANT